MTIQEEDNIIHRVLMDMVNNLKRLHYLPDILSKEGVEKSLYGLILRKLKSEGLIEVPNPNGASAYMIVFTSHGLDVARHEGGYNGYNAAIAAQKQQQAKDQRDKDNLERDTARATVNGVRANWWAVAVSTIGIIVSAIFSVIAQMQSQDTAKDLETAKIHIQTLQSQVTELERHATKAADNRLAPQTPASPLQLKAGAGKAGAAPTTRTPLAHQ